MKKRFTSALALVIFSIVLVAVSFIPANSTNTTSGNLKTGLAISTSVKDSTDATDEKEGLNSTTVTIAAVTVDEEGKIVTCKIDVLEATVKFNKSGIITSDLTSDYLTKKELKDTYGMKQYSSIRISSTLKPIIHIQVCITAFSKPCSHQCICLLFDKFF